MSEQQEYLKGPDQIIPSDTLKAWEASGGVRLNKGDEGVSAHSPISVPSFLKRSAKKFPTVNAMCVKRDGTWKATTYQEYYNEVCTVAKAFIKLGLERFHGVCILGFNSPEWFVANLAAIFAGGLSAGIYTTNSPEACEHCARNCEAQIWVVEDQKQLDKVLKIRERLPKLQTIIQYTGKPTVEGVMSWDEVLDLGRRQSDNELEDRLRRIAINQCCTLIFTSGTTGPPKGVMLSHDNLTWTAYGNSININLIPGKESIISFLPLSHVAAQVADMYICMYAGGTCYFAQPDALKGSLMTTLTEVRPTVFLGVPRVWEKMYEKMIEVGKKTKGVKKSMITWARSVALEANRRKQIQDFRKPLCFSVANSIVFKKVKTTLGFNNSKVLISAAAPISPDIVKHFHSLDITLTEIYGLSESTGPHTIGLEKAFKVGSCGRTPPGFNTKIINANENGNGEICLSGRNIAMGYLHQEEKTHEAIDHDGWLRTGDTGYVDIDNFLFITGRIKEIIITAGGENVAPVPIEDNLKAELPCISNCMLIGDRRKFLSILLTLKTQMDLDTGEPLPELTPACIEWCRTIGSQSKTVQDILEGPDASVMKAIQEGVDRTNKLAISNAQKIQKWIILPKDFSIPGGELGPTMKTKRPNVIDKYGEEIENFYEQ